MYIVEVEYGDISLHIGPFSSEEEAKTYANNKTNFGGKPEHIYVIKLSKPRI